MYEVNQYEDKRPHGGKDKWIFVRINREEAAELIKSLSTQLMTNSPNSGRAETRWKNSKAKGDAEGYFTICVQDPFVCIGCNEEIEPFTGLPYPFSRSTVSLCAECARKRCPDCSRLGTHVKWCQQRQDFDKAARAHHRAEKLKKATKKGVAKLKKATTKKRSR
jgi:hypothetical protein